MNSSTFGPLARVALDDQVDAQPLIVNNVVYVATENDTVYAINANTGAILNSNHLGAPVAMSSLPGPCNNNGQHVGINSTPVINAVAGLMWVVTYTWENNAPVFRLHLLSLTNLTEIKNTIITASHTLSDGSVNNFNPQYQRQRAALLLQNLNVYAAFSSFCDLGGNNSRGWILGWQAETLTPLAANELTDTQTLAQTPNGNANVFLSSIWMSGDGVASDSSGDLFFTTGNSDTVRTDNLQESAVRLSSDLTTVKDFFTPYIYSALDLNDGDFSSGGIMLLPAQSGPVPNLAVAAGKSGYLYIMNRALGSMGGYVAGGPDVPKEITLGPCWCGPSYFAGSDGFGRVVTSQGDVLDTWRVDTTKSVPLILEGTSSLAPDVQDPGFFTSVSSNGTQAGSTIIWAVQRPISATHAHCDIVRVQRHPDGWGSPGPLFRGRRTLAQSQRQRQSRAGGCERQRLCRKLSVAVDFRTFVVVHVFSCATSCRAGRDVASPRPGEYACSVGKRVACWTAHFRDGRPA